MQFKGIYGHVHTWIITGIFLWPFLAYIAYLLFGDVGSDVIAYLGVAIVVTLYIWFAVDIVRLSRSRGMRFTYRLYRKSERKACDKMFRIFGLYKEDYKYIGAFRDASLFYLRIRERRKREHQKWPLQRYIANIVDARSTGNSIPKVTIGGSDAATLMIPNSPTVTTLRP